MIVDELAEEATHIMQVQHFHLQPGDILSFVVTGGRLSKQYEAEIKARIRDADTRGREGRDRLRRISEARHGGA